jgi:tetratricopeptide (TPR) repeat protein
MSAIEAAVRELELSKSPAEARRVVVSLQDTTGLNEAVMGRALVLFGSEAGRAAQLSGHWGVLLKSGDDPALAMRLRGVHERLQGRWRESAKAFVAAGELSPDPVTSLSYQLGAIDGFARAGDVRQAVALGDRLAKALRGQGRPDQAGRALLNTGNALMWADRYVEAQERLLESLPLLEESGLVAETVSARLGLSSVALYLGDLARCQERAREVEAVAEGEGFEYVAALARVNQAHVFMQSGQPDLAVDLLSQLREEFADSPIDLCRIWEFLGDSLYRLNMWSEAGEAYREALRLRRHSTPANAANCRLGLALCAQAEGKPSEKLFRSARMAFSRLGAPAWEAAALTGLAKTVTRDEGVKLARTAAALARKARAPLHEAGAHLTGADMGVGGAVEAAARLIQRHGLIGLEWHLHFIRASRSARPLMHFRRMLESIVAARMLQSSTSARAGFLRDKETAVRAYLSHLLERPTTDRRREAIDVVAQVRSASLVDEILAAAENLLAPEEHSRLQALRFELAGTGAEIPLDSDGTVRRASGAGEHSASDLRVVAGRVFRADARPSMAVLVEVDGGAALLHDGKYRRFRFKSEDLEDELRWLKFELLAPMSERGADAGPALAALAALASQFDVPDAVGLCPDGVMFGLPWAAMAALGDRGEPAIALHPAFSGAGDGGIDPRSRAVLWWDDKADLPFAPGEVEAFLGAFPQAEVCRTAGEVRASMMEPMEVLHVLGHADHNPRNPMFSCLKYSDGEVEAREICASPLRVSFANIAACSSGALSTVMRHEPDGLVRSFLSRGAKSVIGSAWPLDDEAGRILNQDFYFHLAAGLSVRASLREARTTLRGRLAHPYFWGCSTLFGGYLA